MSSWQASPLGELWDTAPVRQAQGPPADVVTFPVACLPETIMHSLLPRLLRACCTDPKELPTCSV